MDRIDELKAFIAIAEAGSLAAAARRLGRSPPALTQMLAALELRYGTRLAERTTRKLALTEAGLRLADHARRLVEDFDESMLDIGGIGAAPRGRLVLSAPQTFGRLHLMPVIHDFLATHLGIEADLVLDDRPVDLIDDRIDIALRIARLENQSLICRRLGGVRRVVVASPAYLARRPAPSRPDDLPGHDILLFANSKPGADWHFTIEDATVAFAPAARFRVNRAEAAIAAARDGLGITRVLSYQVADDLAAGRLVRLLQPFEPPPIPVQFVFSEGRRRTARVRAFLDFAAPRLAALPVLREA